MYWTPEKIMLYAQHWIQTGDRFDIEAGKDTGRKRMLPGGHRAKIDPGGGQVGPDGTIREPISLVISLSGVFLDDRQIEACLFLLWRTGRLVE
jgi:hypothetical protein